MLFTAFLFASNKNVVEKEKAAIQKVIENAYVKGIHINKDIDAIKKGFHPEFNMLILRDDKIIKFPINKWIESIKQRKEKEPEQPEVTITYKFPLIDVTGNAAVAKIEIYKDSKHIYSDYMSLYKFEDGWKIVNKIYYSHK